MNSEYAGNQYLISLSKNTSRAEPSTTDKGNIIYKLILLSMAKAYNHKVNGLVCYYYLYINFTASKSM